ncbi:MAG: tRNA (guanosine(46)-N7)-methyltransferase TrmB [Peptococcia bacterium]
MRLRKKAGINEKLAALPQLILTKPQQYYGNWAKVFGNEQPIHLEIGTGKGSFICGMAKLYPQINFIGIERVPEIIYLASKKVIAEGLPNVRLLMEDAANLQEIFKPGEVERLYLNFSDPWPKTRHARRRLTHPDFLGIYKKVLPPGGAIHLKTDNHDFFEYSLLRLVQEGFSLSHISYDLHKSGYTPNIMTEYEQRFSSLGQPIYRLEAFTAQITKVW